MVAIVLVALGGGQPEYIFSAFVVGSIGVVACRYTSEVDLESSEHSLIVSKLCYHPWPAQSEPSPTVRFNVSLNLAPLLLLQWRHP
jgi:hypothetical protein